jgi:2-methylcitrate synthase
MSSNPEATVPQPPAKGKKSVALSGVTAGNTALCSVGRTGNDLHYRGYDILEVAESCDFEEIAYLLIHGKLPNKAQLAAYKAKLKGLRGLPAPVRAVLEQLPAAAHPMDVLRTGASVMGAVFALASTATDITAASPEAVATGMQITFAVAGALIAMALVLAVGSRVLASRH